MLDWTKKQDVQYAIPMWLRDEQIRANIARVKGRISPGEKRDEPVAVVGFGPSLRDTWEEVRGFPYVVTCSGAHRFLLDRGIVPDWHVEVDPRSHKVELLGESHPDVEYLIASTCSPRYVEHLEKASANIKLWHVFDATEDGKRLLPGGEWAITGGCDVGLRAMALAAFLGFRDVHVFGLDGCAPSEDADRHAAAHPNGKQKYQACEYGGRTYWTTSAMLEAARQTLHELDQMPAVHATFHGEGLTQAMVRDRKPKAPMSLKLQNVVGVSKPELISVEYRSLNEQLHRENLAYGVGGGKHAPTVIKLAESLKTTSVLDYGCGKGYLAKAIPFPIWEYDPAVPGKDQSPRAADLVVCTDVLEHIEPDRIVFVLDDLRRVTRQMGFLVIHTGPSSKKLPDGRNTHILQRDRTWWSKMLGKFFRIAKVWETGPLLYVLVQPGKQKARVKVSAVRPAQEAMA